MRQQANSVRRRLPVVLVLLLGAGALLVVAGRGGSEEASAGSVVAELAALRSAPGRDEALPAQVANGFVRDAGGEMEAARSVGTFEGSDYYLIPTARDQVCLVSRDPYGISGGACVNRTQILEGVSLISLTPDGRRAAATIVPDGYTSPEIQGPAVEKQSEVRRNVAFAKLARKGEARITLRGESGRPDIAFEIHPG